MKKYLLDTNVISELRKPKPHGAVVTWFSSLTLGQIFLSAVTLGELQSGVEQTRKQDQAKVEELERWIDGLIATEQILPMDAACFREWGRLMEGESNHLIEDAMIAATARVHQLTLATRNEKDFVRFSVDLHNPFRN